MVEKLTRFRQFFENFSLGQNFRIVNFVILDLAKFDFKSLFLSSLIIILFLSALIAIGATKFDNLVNFNIIVKMWFFYQNLE